jgi:hypothetical protein
MPYRTPLCLGLVASLLIGTLVVIAVPVVSQAESPLEFLRNQAKRNGPNGQPRTGFFGLFGAPEEAPPPETEPPPSQAMQQPFVRGVCVRVCDQRRFAIRLNLQDPGSEGSARQMCDAAGNGEATQFLVQRIADGGLPPDTAANFANPAPGSSCQSVNEKATFTVPILADATLRQGDIVATREGLKVFVGGPQVPHSPADFISVKQAGIVDPAVTKLQVAMTR